MIQVIEEDRCIIFKIFSLKIKINVMEHNIFLKFLDWIIPKKNNKIVFFSYPDFSDNAREYYEYLKAHHAHKYELVWVYSDIKSKDNKIIKNKFNIYSIKGILALRTAKYIVNTGLLRSCYSCLSRHVLIQLWHGMPFKTLGFNEKDIPEKIFVDYEEYGKYAHFFVTSDIFKLSLISSFLIDNKRIYITGQARTDCIISKRNEEKIKKYIKNEKYAKIVLYTPTYKEFKRNDRRDVDKAFENIFYFDNCSDEKIINFLEENNILLILKPHPFDEEFYKDYYKKYKSITDKVRIIFDNDLKENDFYFYEFFQVADVLITDFSSICIDFLMTKKPVIFLNNLTQQYQHRRGFILEDNYPMLMPGEKVVTLKQLFLAIQDSLTTDSWKEKREQTLPLLHKYLDANASERIYQIMKDL